MKIYLRTLNLLKCIEKRKKVKKTSSFDEEMSEIKDNGTLSHTEQAMMRSILEKMGKADEDVNGNETDINDQLCMNKLHTSISNAMYSVVQDETTARGIWTKL